jgi:hypothetical protein
MTDAEVTEKNADQREQTANREARLQAAETFVRQTCPGSIPLSSHKSSPPTVIPDTPPHVHAHKEEEEEEEEEEHKEKEQPAEDAFMPPPSTAPAMLQPSRAGRKRAPTMKALEAEQAPKRGSGRGNWQGKGKAAGKGVQK